MTKAVSPTFDQPLSVGEGSVQPAALTAYATSRVSFVPGLLPQAAVNLDGRLVLDLLRRRLGWAVDLALDLRFADPERPTVALPPALRSPVAAEPDARWLQHSNLVGINVRTVGDFWGVVKYALTLPAHQNAIHLLPIWEPGVVGSIYGMASWNLNREFWSSELARLCPTLNTTARQLRAVVHLLHAMGKVVGMDVIPHTDRFSEMALAFPRAFEWLRRRGDRIESFAADLHLAVEAEIFGWLGRWGAATPGDRLPDTAAALFAPEISEARRLELLFGGVSDANGRLRRRKLLVQHLYNQGYETVPATMAPPYRGLEIDPEPEAHIVDEMGMEWRDYRITKPQPMSRVFGPLARYRLHERLGDGWELNFERPVVDAWTYVCAKYAEQQRRYGFDFMRGDMAHVQMRPAGVPDQPDEFYDILGAVKRTIQATVPFFGSFAETFVAPRDVMGYGEEIDHLEAAGAEATLGDLQSMVVGSAEFLQNWRHYDDIGRTRRCVPAFTVMTADKDDPRFDRFYLHANELRLLVALLLTDVPSYMALGFEVRDAHPSPAPNEHYTKLFVFHETRGPKATEGPYVWGQNTVLFAAIQRLHLAYEELWPRLRGQATRWLLAPDATGNNPLVAWTQAAEPAYVVVANTGGRAVGRFGLPLVAGAATLTCIFSTAGAAAEPLRSNGLHYPVGGLAAGEARIYRIDLQ